MNTITPGKIKIILVSIAFIFSAYAVSGMGKTDGDKTIPASIQKSGSGLSIKDILDGRTAFEGKEVTITGRFMGWKGRCNTSMPMTRSDWIIEDDSGCIYVSGPLPQGLSALAPKGEPVVVAGVVMKGMKDFPVIQAKDVKLVPVIPQMDKKAGGDSGK